MLKIFSRIMILMCAALLLTAGSAMANMITNGDFETGDLTGWDIQDNVSDVLVANVGDIYGYAALLNAPNGTGSAQLGQHFYISSDIDAITVSFDYLFSGEDSSFWFDDQASGSFSFMANGIWISPVKKQVELISLKSSSTSFNQVAHYTGNIDLKGLYDDDPNAFIEFELCEKVSSSTDTALYLDNVNVVAAPAPVPEPATMLLFGTGLIGIAGVTRRKLKLERPKD